MTRTPRPILGLVVAAALAFGLSACGDDDVTQSKLADDLQEQAGLDEATAECVSEKLFEVLDQSTLNDLYSEDSNEPLTDEQQEAYTNAASECLGGDTTEGEG